MSQKISLSQVAENKFDILQNGNILRIDSTGEEDAKGFRAKPLILSALAGCTAIDVQDILKKMRVEYSDFRIDASGVLTEEPPKIYHTIHLTYFIKLADAEDRSKMEKAVNLSQEKYCGVSAMVKSFADLQVNIEYL
jgi:putative redox protein